MKAFKLIGLALLPQTRIMDPRRRNMKKILALLLIGLSFAGMGVSQPPPDVEPVKIAQGPVKPLDVPMIKNAAAKHPRGYKLAPVEVRVARHKALEHRRVHFKHAKKFLAAPDSFDCEAKGWTIPVSDQGDCGSCHDHSAREVASCSFLVAGVFKAPWNGLSIQALMNCYPEGGNCNGGDEWADCQYILQNGLPTADDYPGPGQGRTGPCNVSSTMKRYKPGNMAYVSADAGLPTAEELMSAMVLYGPISVAGAAGSDWDNVGCDTVISGNSRDVNHAYIYTKYRQVGGNVQFFLQNSWTTSWGCNGGSWIVHGADSSGTEAFFCHVTPVDPVPPGPTPPPGPGPTPPPPMPGTVATFTLSQPLAAGSFEISPPGTAAAISDAAQAMTALSKLLQPVGPTPAPGTLNQRVDAIEAKMGTLDTSLNRLADSVIQLQKLIQGGQK